MTSLLLRQLVLSVRALSTSSSQFFNLFLESGRVKAKSILLQFEKSETRFESIRGLLEMTYMVFPNK